MDINREIQYRKKANMNGGRYNHWFWHSRFLNYIARRACKLDCWIWDKQYGKR